MKQVPNSAESKIGSLLRRCGATVVTAESCTGGLIGNLLTDVSGSSGYYLGGVIAYANEVKRDVLAVRAETLATVGAVSRETALQMAQGVRHLLEADYALATTGIAGPTGGTAAKPVGPWSTSPSSVLALSGASGTCGAKIVWATRGCPRSGRSRC